MHHLEIEQQDHLEKIAKRAEQIRAEKAEAAMEILRRREPYVTGHRKIAEDAIKEADDLGRREPVFDDYNEPTNRKNRRVQGMEYSDTVNHPAHYTQGGVECIEILEQLAADGHDFRILNAIKYLWRYRHKGGDESLRKALWYINRVLGDG